MLWIMCFFVSTSGELVCNNFLGTYKSQEECVTAYEESIATLPPNSDAVRIIRGTNWFCKPLDGQS